MLLVVLRSGWAFLVAATLAGAEARAETPEQALAVARAAFEYRDFEQVLTALDRWVHPPRITDRVRMTEARVLLGVAHHVLGDEQKAREQFGLVLLLDPSHQLDRFAIPPQVVATFEEVREAMADVLAAREPEERPRLPLSVAFLPLGAPQFSVDAPGVGLFLGAMQVVGLALNIGAHARADSFPRTNPPAEKEVWDALQYTGLAVLVLAYGASIAHGLVAIDRDP